MTVTAEQIVSGLMQRGVPRMAALALAGNSSVESGFDPSINEISPVVEGSRGGFGLWQHTGPRRRELEQFAADRGADVSDPEVQMDFVVWELANTEKAAASKIYQAQTPEEAARAVSESFLRPGVPHMDRRIAATQAIADGAQMKITNIQQVDSSNAPDYSRLTRAYNEGRMNEEQRAVYEAAVADGRIQVNAPQQPAKSLSQGIIAAYKAGNLTPEQRAIVDNAISSGEVARPRDMVWEADFLPGPDTLPEGTAPRDTPQVDDRYTLDQAYKMSGPFFETANAAAAGVFGRGPSVAGQIFGDTPENPPSWFGRNVTNRVADLGLAGVSTLGGVIFGGAGLAGDALDAAGLPGGDRIGRDFGGMIEAASGGVGQRAKVLGNTIKSVDIPNAGATSRLADDVARAEASGVQVLTTDVFPPRTAIGRRVRSAGESIPYTGTGGVRATQFEARQNAIRNLAREFSEPDTPIDTVLANLSDDFLRVRADRLTRYYNQKTRVIEGLPQDIPVDMSRTVSAIDSEIARLRGLRSREYEPVIRKLEDWKASIVDQPLANVEALRQQMGQSFKADSLASVKDEGQRVVSRIYGPLREDMGAFIRQNGNRRDFDRWQVANRRLSDMMGELNVSSLRNMLNTAEETPENIGKILFSQKTSDVRRLYNGLSPEGRANARATVMIDMIQRAGGIEGISPARFASQVSRQGRQIGVMFTENDQAVINGLMRTIRLTSHADRAGLNPPTGVQAVPYLAFDVTSRTIGGPVGATVTVGGVGAITRGYESRFVRNLLMRLSRTEPGSAAERRIIVQLNERGFDPGALAAATIPAQQGQKNDNIE